MFRPGRLFRERLFFIREICIKLQDPDYFTRMEIKESLEERFNAKVDVVSLTAIMRSLFRNHIEKDAIYI